MSSFLEHAGAGHCGFSILWSRIRNPEARDGVYEESIGSALSLGLMSTITGLKNERFVTRRSNVVPTIFCVISMIIAIGDLSGCVLFNHEHLIYDRKGIRIGLEADPSLSWSNAPVLNNHPVDLTSKDLELLLQTIQVSGYSGTILGLITKPQPAPLFTPKELSAISEHLATAFRGGKPTERVFFSLPKPDVAYSEDRTIGALFFRGPYLHIVVTDHSSIIRIDTGGGDYRDIRDTKGMILSVAGPVQAAMVPGSEEPQWAHFEKVRISLPVKEVLAQRGHIPAAGINQRGMSSPVLLPAAPPAEGLQGSTSPEELQRQLREFTVTNQELRGRLDEQNKRMQLLQEQVEQLRRELPNSDLKGHP
jgi:hypothetical protein